MNNLIENVEGLKSVSLFVEGEPSSVELHKEIKRMISVVMKGNGRPLKFNDSKKLTN